jgi:hypothetical protein
MILFEKFINFFAAPILKMVTLSTLVENRFLAIVGVSYRP